MMMNLIATIALLASSAMAIPASGDYSIRSGTEDLPGPITPMTFSGPVKVGGPVVQLQGTAKEIYEQILVLNPLYTPWDFPDFQEDQAAKNVTRAEWEQNIFTSTNTELATRNTLVERSGNLETRANRDCGYGSWVRTWGDCFEGRDYLRALGKAWCGANAWSCSRVSCSHSCGVFLCSQRNSHYQASCGDIANDMVILAENCGQSVYGGAMYRVRGKLDFGDHNTHLVNSPC